MQSPLAPSAALRDKLAEMVSRYLGRPVAGSISGDGGKPPVDPVGSAHSPASAATPSAAPAAFPSVYIKLLIIRISAQLRAIKHGLSPRRGIRTAARVLSLQEGGVAGSPLLPSEPGRPLRPGAGGPLLTDFAHSLYRVRLQRAALLLLWQRFLERQRKLAVVRYQWYKSSSRLLGRMRNLLSLRQELPAQWGARSTKRVVLSLLLQRLAERRQQRLELAESHYADFLLKKGFRGIVAAQARGSQRRAAVAQCLAARDASLVAKCLRVWRAKGAARRLTRVFALALSLSRQRLALRAWRLAAARRAALRGLMSSVLPRYRAMLRLEEWEGSQEYLHALGRECLWAWLALSRQTARHRIQEQRSALADDYAGKYLCSRVFAAWRGLYDLRRVESLLLRSRSGRVLREAWRTWRDRAGAFSRVNASDYALCLPSAFLLVTGVLEGRRRGVPPERGVMYSVAGRGQVGGQECAERAGRDDSKDQAEHLRRLQRLSVAFVLWRDGCRAAQFHRALLLRASLRSFLVSVPGRAARACAGFRRKSLNRTALAGLRAALYRAVTLRLASAHYSRALASHALLKLLQAHCRRQTVDLPRADAFLASRLTRRALRALRKAALLSQLATELDRARQARVMARVFSAWAGRLRGRREGVYKLRLAEDFLWARFLPRWARDVLEGEVDVPFTPFPVCEIWERGGHPISGAVERVVGLGARGPGGEGDEVEELQGRRAEWTDPTLLSMTPSASSKHSTPASGTAASATGSSLGTERPWDLVSRAAEAQRLRILGRTFGAWLFAARRRPGLLSLRSP